MQNNLTTLANAQTWLGISTTTDNALLARLIGAASRAIHTYLQRPNLFQHTINEVYDGSGSRRQYLKQWPVLSISSLSVGSTSISVSPSYGQTGYYLDPWDGYPPGRPQALTLTGHVFWPGHSNVFISYLTGYVVQNEVQTIPSSYQITVNAPYGPWAVDQGVTYANGTAMTPVSGSPTVGQYAVSGGIYTFAAADSGQGVLISYSFIPSDIEQACIEMVGERYRTKDRIGENSKTLGGQETVSFATDSMNKYVRELLQPFRKVILC